MFYFLFLFIASFLFASDNRTAQSQREVHRQLQEYFQQEKREDWWNSPYMTGDWNGARATLAKVGITFASSFTTDSVGNPSGGRAQGFAYAGSYGLSINIDLTKAGWTGFELFSSAVWRTGTSLTMRKIGNQFPVQQVFGSQTVKLNELYFIQTLCRSNLAFKAGRLDPCNDFLASPLYGQFVNNGFDGNPISIFFNVPITAYPNPTWGAYLFFKPFKRLSAKFAVYNANSDINKNKYHGVNFTFKSTNGVIWITEWCVLNNQAPGDHGMPGNYKVGYFFLTGDEPKFSGGKERGDPCFYILLDQMIYRRGGADSNQGLTPFISLVFQPKNRNLIPFFFDGGLVFRGPLSSRPKDVASVGYIYGKFSPDKARVDRQAGKEPQNFESVIEASYWAQINPWFYIMPDLQYIIHPKGLDIPNAFVIGAQIGLNL
jgi:porin